MTCLCNPARRLFVPSAFLGVQQQQRLVVTNTCRLPLQYSWHVVQQQQQQQGAASAAAQPRGHLGVSVVPAAGSLQPGQEVEVQLLLEPLAVGPADVLLSCNVAGTTDQPAGCLLSAQVEGLRVRHTISPPGAPAAASCSSDGGSANSSSGVEAAASTSAAVAGQPLVADFGVLALHQVGELLLTVSNLTSMEATVTAWVERFPSAAKAAGAADAQQQQMLRLTRASPQAGRQPSGSSSCSTGRLVLSTVAALPAGCSSGTGAARATQPPPGDAWPFRAPAGNAMMAARQLAAAAAAALADGRGCAVTLEPVDGGSCRSVPGWGSLQLRILAFNNMPGTYADTLHVQVRCVHARTSSMQRPCACAGPFNAAAACPPRRWRACLFAAFHCDWLWSAAPWSSAGSGCCCRASTN